ncbi:MAG: PQQ-binding-like beta-propeller repeat protein [Cyclobacteriaceae bacterium]
MRTDANNVVVEKPYRWSASLSDSELISGGIQPSLDWNSYVLFGGWLDGSQVLHMKNSEDGSTLWQWSDHLLDGESFNIRNYHVHDNLMVISQGPRAYCIDLSNGQTVWRKQTDSDLGALIKGVGDRFFLSEEITNQDGHLEAVVTAGKVLTGELQEIVRPPYNYEYVNGLNRIGSLGGIHPFIVNAGDTLIFTTYGNYLPDWKLNNFLGLYNISKKSWIYNEKAITATTLFGAGGIFNFKEKVYLQSGKSLFCYEIATGNKLWERSFSEGFSDMIVVEDKLIGNNEDRFLYAFDPDTGRQLWKEQSSGTSSPLAYLNGVVYFTGGGDGLLHAVEVETGQHLWRIRSPDLEHNSGAWFKRHVAVVPPAKEGEKGKVLTSSYLSAFCYEAAR